MRRLRKLQRLLLDGDVDLELLDYLVAVGFDAVAAPRDNPSIQDDVKMVRLARKLRRILVCHDQHKDRKTRLRLYPELYKKGGKILCIIGSPSQPLLKSLGKVLLHQDEWAAWFRQNNGIVEVQEGRWRASPASDLIRSISVETVVGRIPWEKLNRTRKAPARRPKVSPYQQPLLEGNESVG